MTENGSTSRCSRLRLAWVEEWMSMLAAEVLPYLAQRHEITYVTAGDEIPKADFARVIRGKRWRYINVAGFELSERVNRLYREGSIDMALVWASIGFGLRGVPFINFEGTSVYAEIGLFASMTPVHKRIKYLTGLAHFALPEMLCNRRAARVVAPSQALKNDIMRLHNLTDNTVAVVPHGVEAKHLALFDKKPPGLPPAILFVGRLHFRKGIAALLKEFVKRRDIDAEFFIAGDGPDRLEMEQQVTGDPRVKILGNVARTELESLLTNTNVFVFPTYYEGFGLALTEAMASGHACVCYDIPIVREVLSDTGVLVPPGKAAALIEQVARLVRNPERIAAYSALAHNAAARFSWDDARETIDLIIRDAAATVETQSLKDRQLKSVA
ncbi:MAG TPA: glycosyltransferase family 4 protein [Candidatus Binatia bacterium]